MIYIIYSSYFKAIQIVREKKLDAILGILDPNEISLIDYNAITYNLFLQFHDIHHEHEMLDPPLFEHVSQMTLFFNGLPDNSRLLIHCFAGMSRSAAAFLIANHYCNKITSPYENVRQMMERNQFATPNPLMLTYAGRENPHFLECLEILKPQFD